MMRRIQVVALASCTLFMPTVIPTSFVWAGDRATLNGTVLLGQRSNEFDDTPTTPNPANNPVAPPYPQQPGPNIIRPEFDDAARDAVSDVIRNGKCDYPKMFYIVYINGVGTDGHTYGKTTGLISQLLSKANISNPFVREVTYNYSSGNLAGDLIESVPQSLLGITTSSDGIQLIKNTVEQLKESEKRYRDLNQKTDCDCRIPKPEYLLIAESQGNFFAQEIINRLPVEITERMGVLSISSFTDYGKARNKLKVFQYMLRPDEIAAVANGRFTIKNPGTPNLPPFPTLVSQATQNNDGISLLGKLLGYKLGAGGLIFSELSDALKKAGVPWQQAYYSHLVPNYLGTLDFGPLTGNIQVPEKDIPAFNQTLKASQDKAIATIKNIFASIEDANYSKPQKQCSATPSQPSQPVSTTSINPRITRLERVYCKCSQLSTLPTSDCVSQGGLRFTYNGKSTSIWHSEFETAASAWLSHKICLGQYKQISGNLDDANRARMQALNDEKVMQERFEKAGLLKRYSMFESILIEYMGVPEEMVQRNQVNQEDDTKTAPSFPVRIQEGRPLPD